MPAARFCAGCGVRLSVYCRAERCRPCGGTPAPAGTPYRDPRTGTLVPEPGPPRPGPRYAPTGRRIGERPLSTGVERWTGD